MGWVEQHKRTTTSAHGRERRLSVRSVRKENPELAKLSPVLLALAQAEAEARELSTNVHAETARGNSRPRRWHE